MTNKTVEDFLRTTNYKDDPINFCANYYLSFIKGVEKECDAKNNFICLLKWDGFTDEQFKSDMIYSKDDYQTVLIEVYGIVKKIIDNIVCEDIEENIFYDKVWEKFSDYILFPKEIDKVCVLCSLMLEPRIPYYRLGQALKMENDLYKDITLSIKEEISKSFYILQYGYTQKTEIASQLYKVVKCLSDENKRIVLIAHILDFYNSQINSIRKSVATKKNIVEEIDEES